MRVKSIKYIILILVTSCILTLFSCSNYSITGDKTTVAVTIVPQKTFVKAVAGNMVNIVTLIPPGYSPANYQPSPRLMEDFSKASVYFTIGVPAEESNILPRAGKLNTEAKIVKLSDIAGEVYPHRYFDNSNNERDPHIWMSPKRVSIMIDAIAKELSALDNEHRDLYEKNAARYKNQLNKLDKEIRNTLEGLSNKRFIIYHPSLGYFADEYNLTMLSIEYNGKKATAQRLEYLIDRALKENIKIIFYQAEIDSRQSRAFAEEIEGKAVKIAPLAPDYIDNLRNIAQTFKSMLN